MDERTPLDILMADFLPAERVAEVEQEVSKINELPPVKKLGELATPVYGNDPSELIKDRFLYLGGVALLLGPTGIGKSALDMQLGIHVAIGKPLFDIRPAERFIGVGMNVLLIQAENDEGDLAEMRDGVLRGCTDLTDEEKARALRNITICTICDRSGERFAEALAGLVTEHGPFDLVITDPAFAYLGGDSNSQKDVSFFMRELLNPILQKHRVGMILTHHTNKPLRGKEKDSWAAGDFAYLGAGSAEWINPARAALAIRSLGSDTVFELRAPKRGRRLGWKDSDGMGTVVKYIAHHDEPGVICWREARPDEVEAVLSKKGGRPRKCDPVEVLHCIAARPGQSQGFYTARIASVMGCSESVAKVAVRNGVETGCIRFVEVGREKRYSLSTKGAQKVDRAPSAYDWTGLETETP